MSVNKPAPVLPAKWALITGASSGLGAEFARQLAAGGFSLVLVARRRQRLLELAKELHTQFPVQTEIWPADLSKARDLQVLEKKIARLKNLELLVNNAGFGTGGRFFEADLGKQLDMLTVHIEAAVRLSRAALPALTGRGKGGIINLASVAAFVPTVGNVNYSASKAFLVRFSEALQMELDGTGVRVQALCPGFTHTEFHSSPEYRNVQRTRLPECFWMTAREVVKQSLRALKKRRTVYIPGFLNRLLVTLATLPVTRFWIRRAAIKRQRIPQA